MTGPSTTPAHTNAPADFEKWFQDVSQDVARRGFLGAWKDHLPEVLAAYREGTAPDGMVGSSLLALLREDPRLRPHLENVSVEVPAAVASVGTIAGGGVRPGPDFAAEVRALYRDLAIDHPDVVEGDGKPMKCLPNQVFQNWGRTVENTPSATFLPTTKDGVRNLVKWAAAKGLNVRSAGYRHTWTDLYSSEGQALVSMLPLDVVEDLPALEPPIDPDNQLQGIRLVGTVQEGGVTKALCKIGAATTNEQFRRWCLDANGGNWAWTIPLNVIMVEITWGGSNAPICHGAGWRNRTLSDLVVEIEFVNARGEIQTVNDPDLLSAAAGCFGLLGVVTAVTLKLDPMTYARMVPEKPRLALTIPPPAGFSIPPAVNMQGITPEELRAAWAGFVDRCENAYYSEWFWFPYRDDCWVNVWKNDGRREDAVRYPNECQTLIEQTEAYLGELTNCAMKPLPGWLQAEILAATAMYVLPSETTIVTPLIEALHFRRGIQNMRVLDMEFQIPIPPRADDPTKPDWTVCQRAWWDAIAAVYSRDDAPMRIAMEMRIMAGSNILMAPQYGNTFGTCSIEVLTNLNVAPDAWKSFMQQVVDSWDSYLDPSGVRLNVRPHWAKQWQGLKLRGMDAADYLRTVAYKDRIPEFKDRLAKIAQAGGYTLADLQKRFSNPLCDRIFQLV